MNLYLKQKRETVLCGEPVDQELLRITNKIIEIWEKPSEQTTNDCDQKCKEDIFRGMVRSVKEMERRKNKTAVKDQTRNRLIWFSDDQGNTMAKFNGRVWDGKAQPPMDWFESDSEESD